MLERGLVQVYTGNGKGKTTAAFGLALRMAGHGGKVLIYQFLKPKWMDLGERAAFARVEHVTIKAIEKSWDMWNSSYDPDAVDQMKEAIANALAEIETAAHEKYYDVIVMDEIVFCLGKGLVEMEQIRSVVENRARGVEMILTGRGATEELIALADLVTEMKMIKHPYDQGISARRGIEY